MPPPITSSRFGTVPSSSAPVECTIRSSSGSAPSEAASTRRDDAVVKRDRAILDLHGVRTGQPRGAVHHFDLTLPREPAEPVGQLRHDRLLPVAQPVEVHLWRAKRDPALAHLLRLGDHARGVEERLGGDAADVQAHAPEALVALDQHGLQARNRRPGTRRCTRRDPPRSPPPGRRFDRPGRGEGGSRTRHRWSRGFRCGSRRDHRSLQRQQHAALGDAIADFTLSCLTTPGGRGRDVHRRLVGLERDERVLERDLVAWRDMDLDHRDVREVPDVRDPDLGALTAAPGADRSAPSRGRRRSARRRRRRSRGGRRTATAAASAAGQTRRQSRPV